MNKLPFCLATGLVVLYLANCIEGSRLSGCSMTASVPKDSFNDVDSGSNFITTCTFTTTCPVTVHIYRKKSKDGNRTEMIESTYWWIDQGVPANEECREIKKNRQYECNIMIYNINKRHSGAYLCVIKERGNLSHTVSEDFRIDVKGGTGVIDNFKCFMPSPVNITAIPTYYANGSVGVRLAWNSSRKEDNNIEYCTGSRKWQVRVLSYSDVNLTPGDKQYVNPSGISWNIVPGQNQTYKFTRFLNNATYYQFQIENIEDELVGDRTAKTYGSHVYYFGKQSRVIIDQAQQQQQHTITLYTGQSKEIPCTASGFPTPDVKWLISSDSQSISQVKSPGSSTLYLDSVTVADKGTYVCIGSNTIVNPPSGKRLQHHVWQVNVVVKAYNASATGLYCLEITTSNTYCKRYLHTEFSVFTNNSNKVNREDVIGNAMTKVNSYVKVGKCRDLVYSILCHTVYPYCDVRSGVPTPRMICNAPCMEFINSSECGAGAMQQQDPQLYQLITSHCDHSHRKSGDPPECIPLSYQASKIDQTEPIIDTGSCIRGNGRGYTGNEARTESNSLCQIWSLQSPHKHPMLPTIYASELERAGYACRNPGGLGDKPWCYTNDPKIRWEYCDIPKCDSCEPYNGTICADIKGYNHAKVFVRRGKNINNWRDIERKISNTFVQVHLYQQPTKGCEAILKVLLCHSAFPHCVEGSEEQAKDLCEDHCNLLNSLHQFCPNVYREYTKFVSTNSDFLSTATCSSNSKQSCVGPKYMHVPALSNQALNPQNSTDTCYSNNGILYRGNVSQTRNDITCQSWDSNSPHSHITKSDRYPELVGAKNYCRNPGQLLSRPWCYTTGTAEWDYCDIPICSYGSNNLQLDAAAPGNNVVSTGKGVNVQSALVSVLVIVGCCLVIGILGVVLLIGFLKRRKKKLAMRKYSLSTDGAFMKEEKYVVNPDYSRTNSSTRSSGSDTKVPENFQLLESKQIKYVSQLGQGNFGIVFKGRAFNIIEGEEEEEIDVAVKTLKEEASSEVVQNFIDEAKLMFTFDHPNILKIYGVCMSEMPYQMVFEYMDEGDLTHFLRSRASSAQRRLLNPFGTRSRTESSYSNDPPSLTKTQLLHICTQIADGMKYLSSINHVHRDLACRNCLIKSDLTVKIGDFGMSRNLYSKDYYRINGQAVLPVRWMSPESLIYGKFSIEGDVWSFGVVMWEVFSYALQPYYGISNEEVTEAIRRGKTLNRPDNCPSEIYKLMKECWTMDPAERPTFEELYMGLMRLNQSEQSDYEDESDDAFSYDSDVPSDAFYSEGNSIDGLSVDCISNGQVEL